MLPRFDREKIFRILYGARRVLYRSLLVAACFSAVSFIFSKNLIIFLTQHVHVTLYYFNLSEVFFSSVEMAIYTGLFFATPVIVLFIWREFRDVLTGKLSTDTFMYSSPSSFSTWAASSVTSWCCLPASASC